MNSLIVAFFCVAVAVAQAGTIVQGPSTRTTVVGPDGSTIVADAPGGVISTGTGPAVIAATGPAVLAAPAVVAAPALLRAAPGIIATGPALVHAAPALIGSPLLAQRALISANNLNGITVDALGRVQEGQWVPDINEHLYDDGSYKPGLYL